MTASNTLRSTIQGIASKAADNIILVGLVGLLIILLGWFGLSYFNAHAYTVKTTADVRNLIVSGVHNVSELTTASTDSKATVVVNQEKQIFGIPVGDTNLVYEGVGTIRAGIDIANLEVTNLDVPQHLIEIKLPSPYISEVNLKVEKSSTLAGYRHWFGDKAGAELYEVAQNRAISKIKQEACANHILEAASGNAKNLIENILTQAGFENIKINVEPANKQACATT